MRIFLAALTLFMLTVCAPAMAGQLKPDPVDDLASQSRITVPKVVTNFNLGASHAHDHDDYPHGKNGYTPPAETLADVIPKESEYLCIGGKCGCGGK